MTAAIVDRLTAADPRDLAILDENGCVTIAPSWAKSLHPRAPTVEKLTTMVESAAGHALAELTPSVIEQWATVFLGGCWNG